MIHDRHPWPTSDDRSPLDRHVPGCPCEECSGYASDPTLVEEASRTAGWALIGLVVGFLVTALVDLAIGGPGLRVMVGL